MTPQNTLVLPRLRVASTPPKRARALASSSPPGLGSALLLFAAGAAAGALALCGAGSPATPSVCVGGGIGGAASIAAALGERPLSVAAFASPAHWHVRNSFLSSWSPADFASAAASLAEFRGSLSRLTQGAAAWRAEGHARFDASPPLASCAPLARSGGSATGDGGKWLCGLPALAPGCVIYSLGSNNEWDFEEAMLAETPCEIFTFDCTSDPPKVDMGPRLHFERTCLGDGAAGDARFHSLSEIAARHNHSAISLLKVDIEGFEYGVVETLWRGAMLAGGGGGGGVDARAQLLLLPDQLSIEVHDVTIMDGLAWSCGDPCRVKPPPYPSEVLLSPGDMLPLWVQLTDLGYVVVSRENNPMCTECVEFTLVRAFS